ncbi:MAG: bifunctional nuclease domain-containing protein [Bacteroidia bacterium]
MPEKVRMQVASVVPTPRGMSSFMVILREVEGKTRTLPIVIGYAEAQAIATEMENIRPTRPMTHDLMMRIIQQLGYRLEEIFINDLKEDVFYARLILESTQEKGIYVEIDARPSDAIALAVRTQAPIYCDEEVLEEAGVYIEQIEANPAWEEPSRKEPPQDIEDRKEILRRQLEEALRQENYELAARLRDELNALENEQNDQP